VLWFDLMFDVQTVGHSGIELPAEILASIGGYYARVTTAARPMNRLVALAMLATIASIVLELVRHDVVVWRGVVSLVLAISAIGLAGVRTVPNAVRLGTQSDDRAAQSRLARAILKDHVVCLASIAVVLVLQLFPA
jgi:hypothetical protein